jgi:beta-glucosidase
VRPARLLFPALRWHPERGFDHEVPRIETALSLGVGGFVLFGGEAAAVRELVAELQLRSPHPLLVAADLERGAGQQFRGATPLPPLGALGALADEELTRRAGALTGREALALGVNWVLAPVADLANEPRNPIVGTRSFGADPEPVAAHVAAWVEGCAAAGALTCVKHFPGHGRTTTDSHAELPLVAADAATLELELAPFLAGIRAGADAVMTAHVAYPALDPAAVPATLSAPIVSGLLRERLGFRGLIATDALNMAGVLGAGGEPAAALRAVLAGCDAILYPDELEAVAAQLAAACDDEAVAERVAASAARIAAAAARVPTAPRGAVGRAGDVRWADAVAQRALVPVRGRAAPAAAFELLTVDDDLGGPFPAPSRAVLPAALRDAGFAPREVDALSGTLPAVVAVYADIRAWKGRPGLSAEARETLRRALTVQPDALVLLCAHPRLAAEVPGTTLVSAWGGEPLMQRAAAAWLAAARRTAAGDA